MSQLTIQQLRELSDDELKEISLRRKKNGAFTSEANLAQKVRNERAGQVMPHACNGKSPRHHSTSDRQGISVRKIGVKKH